METMNRTRKVGPMRTRHLLVTTFLALLWQLLVPLNEVRAERRPLEPGDRLPSIRLPSLTTNGTLSLAVTDGKLTFTDAEGETSQPAAAVVFFVRY
jgi:hypothetical protein